MSTHRSQTTIRCWNDCQMSGCPSHLIEIEANNTSNSLVYGKDNQLVFGMDFDELANFIREVHKMRHWVEINALFRELATQNKE